MIILMILNKMLNRCLHRKYLILSNALIYYDVVYFSVVSETEC